MHCSDAGILASTQVRPTNPPDEISSFIHIASQLYNMSNTGQIHFEGRAEETMTG